MIKGRHQTTIAKIKKFVSANALRLYVPNATILVHICWRLGNLKKTYLGNLRLPKFGCWCLNGWVKTLAHVCYPPTHSNIIHSYRAADVRSNIGSRSSNGHCQWICTIIRSRYFDPPSTKNWCRNFCIVF